MVEHRYFMVDDCSFLYSYGFMVMHDSFFFEKMINDMLDL